MYVTTKFPTDGWTVLTPQKQPTEASCRDTQCLNYEVDTSRPAAFSVPAASNVNGAYKLINKLSFLSYKTSFKLKKIP